MNELDRHLAQRRHRMNTAFAGYDPEASLRRVAAQIAQEELTAALTRPRLVGAVPRSGGFVDANAAQTEAAADLERVCHSVVVRPDTSEFLSGFVHQRLPAGALVFSCLLYLTGRPAAAAFWWRYAAGADNHEAMHCLALHHRVQGEPVDSRYWGDRVPAGFSVPTSAVGDPGVYVVRAEPGIKEVDDPDLGRICLPCKELPRRLSSVCGL